MSTNDIPHAECTNRAVQQGPESFNKRLYHYYHHPARSELPKGVHPIKGKAPDENSLLLCGNDYLAIAEHPKIVQAQTKSLLEHGSGILMSSVFLAKTSPQRMFELKLARFLQAEDTLLCQSGWCANVGLLQSIADENTIVYMDMRAHMSLWEGARIAQAKIIPFRHNNPQSLRRLSKRYGAGIIIFDTIYSTHGDIAPIKDFVDIAKETGSFIVADESHSLGTHGPHGEGLVCELNLQDDVHFRTASLAKAFAGRGGVIITNDSFSEYIRFESRPAIFSSAVLPHEADAFSTTIDVIKQESWRRSKLKRNSTYLKYHLMNMGYNVATSQSHIFALEAGHIKHTVKLRDELEKKGIFGSVFMEPATPKNHSLLRLTVNSSLTIEQLNRVVSALYLIRDKVELAKWPSNHGRATKAKIQAAMQSTAMQENASYQNEHVL